MRSKPRRGRSTPGLDAGEIDPALTSPRERGAARPRLPDLKYKLPTEMPRLTQPMRFCDLSQAVKFDRRRPDYTRDNRAAIRSSGARARDTTGRIAVTSSRSGLGVLRRGNKCGAAIRLEDMAYRRVCPEIERGGPLEPQKGDFVGPSMGLA